VLITLSEKTLADQPIHQIRH